MAKEVLTSRQRRRICKAFRQAHESLKSSNDMGYYLTLEQSLNAAYAHSVTAWSEAQNIVYRAIHPNITEKGWLRAHGARYVTDKKLAEWRLMYLEKLIKAYS